MNKEITELLKAKILRLGDYMTDLATYTCLEDSEIRNNKDKLYAMQRVF